MCHDAVVQHQTVFRPRSNLVIAGGLFVCIAGFTAAALASHAQPTVVLPAAAATALAVQVLFVRPRVVLADNRVTIVNPLHTITAGWDAVTHIDAKYSVYLDIDGRRVNAWAGPAPSRYHARSVHPAELRGLQLPQADALRAAESPRADSGVLLHLARRAQQRFAERGVPSGVALQRTTQPGATIAALACGVTAVLVSMLHG